MITAGSNDQAHPLANPQAKRGEWQAASAAVVGAEGLEVAWGVIRSLDGSSRLNDTGSPGVLALAPRTTLA